MRDTSQIFEDFSMTTFRSLTSLLLAFSLVLQGCATIYTGPNPNLSLQGQEAEEEYKRFAFVEDGFWGQGLMYKMGPEKKRYKLHSLEPVIASVSTSATDMIESAHRWRKAQLGFLILAIGTIVAAFADNAANSDSQWHKYSNLYWGSIIASLGTGFVAFGKLANAGEQYNKDLRLKLSPTVGFNLSF